MTLFVDTFDGPDGQLVSARTGWGATPGYVEVLKINGSGAVRNDAYVEDPKSVIHDTGALDHYIKVVIGAGYVSSQGKVSLGVSQTGGAPKFTCSYLTSTTTLQIRGMRGGSYQALTDLTIALAAGDEIYIEQNDTAKTLVIKRNGATVFTNPDTSYYNDPAYSGVGFVLDYSGLAATDDIIRSFEANTLGGDVTAPTLTSATGTTTGDTTASGSVSTNEANGTLYYVATVNSTEAAATVKAGASQPVTATGLQSISISSLSPGTTYYIHYLHRDAAGNDSLVATSNAFTTTAPDVTAPTLTSPTATATGSTTATGSVSTNEANGTLYFYASTNATESVATVKASGASQAVTVTGAQGVSVTGLSGSTTYYLHFVHTDAANNDSARVTSASFTTSVAPGTAKLTLPALRNNTGTLLANEVDATVHIYEVASGNKVATVTGATSDSAGMLVVHSSSMTSGTQYRAVVVLASGAEGLQKVTATV